MTEGSPLQRDRQTLNEVYELITRVPSLETQNARLAMQVLEKNAVEASRMVRKLSEVERRALYETADKDALTLMESVLFDHPTFEIFEAWLHNERLVRLKGVYAGIRFLSETTPIATKSLKRSLKPILDELNSGYLKIVDDLYPTILSGFVETDFSARLCLSIADEKFLQGLMDQAEEIAYSRAVWQDQSLKRMQRVKSYGMFLKQIEYSDIFSPEWHSDELFSSVSYHNYTLSGKYARMPFATNFDTRKNRSKKRRELRNTSVAQYRMPRIFSREIMDGNLVDAVPLNVEYILDHSKTDRQPLIDSFYFGTTKTESGHDTLWPEISRAQRIP